MCEGKLIVSISFILHLKNQKMQDCARSYGFSLQDQGTEKGQRERERRDQVFTVGSSINGAVSRTGRSLCIVVAWLVKSVGSDVEAVQVLDRGVRACEMEINKHWTKLG